MVPFSFAHVDYFESTNPGLTIDNPVYFIDTISEKLIIYSTFSNSRKAIQELKFASEKLSEAKKVSNIENFEKTINLYTKYIESSRSRLEKSEIKTLDFADLLYELTNYEYELLTLRESLILESKIPATKRDEYRKELGNSFSDFTIILVSKTPTIIMINGLSPEDTIEFSHRMESIQDREKARAEMKITKTKMTIDLIKEKLTSKNFSDLEADVIVDISDNIDSVNLNPIPELPVSATTFDFNSFEDYFKKAVLELRSSEDYFNKKDYKRSYYSSSFASELINSIVTFI